MTAHPLWLASSAHQGSIRKLLQLPFLAPARATLVVVSPLDF